MASVIGWLKTRKIRGSLRRRFITYFLLIALLVAAIFSSIVIETERRIAAEYFHQRLNSELKYFAQLYQQNPTTPLPSGSDIRSFLGTDKMASTLRILSEGYSDGIFYRDLDFDEFQDDELRFGDNPRDRKEKRGILGRNRDRLEESEGKGIEDLIFGIKTLHDGKKIYIFIDFKYMSDLEREIQVHRFWGSVIISFIAVILALFTANRFIKPLERLMEVVNSSDPNNIPSGFSQLFKKDEFGALAKALEEALTRVKKFILREKQFTRDASHELRTPVTVVKGAVELLKMAPACKEEMVDKLVKRIERSSLDMETTIESLLWLAREPDSGGSHPLCDIIPLAREAIEQNRHLISGKPVEMEFEELNPVLVSAPAGVLAIAISNLIRNACQFTSRGKIIVSAGNNRIVVKDTGIGIAKEDLDRITEPSVTGERSQGFGFGLDIVKRLCQRFGWELVIESNPGQGTQTGIIFPVE